MDYYCIERGTLLDNRNVETLKGPEEHSVHCLVDVGVCVNSPFEVLVEPLPGDEYYRRAWRLTGDTQPLVVDLARSVGKKCSTCTGEGDLQRGFRAALRASVMDLDPEDGPPVLAVTSAEHSNGVASPCGVFFNMEEQDPVV